MASPRWQSQTQAICPHGLCSHFLPSASHPDGREDLGLSEYNKAKGTAFVLCSTQEKPQMQPFLWEPSGLWAALWSNNMCRWQRGLL